jgi:hypothetical protein
MSRNGRISLLIDSPLRSLLLVMRNTPSETRRQMNKASKAAMVPIWKEEVTANAETRLQHRVLVDSATVGVTARNAFLRSGGTGTLRTGTPVSMLAQATEWGLASDRTVASRSRAGTEYTRRAGNAFGPRRRDGHVVWKAARRSIPRIASLWIQTAMRTLLDAIDGKK